MKTLIIVTTIFLFASFYGCGRQIAADLQTDKDIIPVKVISIDKKDIKKSISVSGQFTSEDETFLSFKTGGIISKIYVKEGDVIRKGQVLAQLNLTEINAQVKQTQIGYEKTIRDYNRIANLYRDSVVTFEQFQNTKTAMEIAEQQFTMAKYNLELSEIRAISDGYVLKKLANDGQLVSPGTPVLQTNGGNKGNWILKAGVSDIEWASININDKAEIEIDAEPEMKYPAYIVRKSESIDPASGTLAVFLKLNSKMQLKIASGMFGKAIITKETSVSSWEIPYESIIDGNGKTGYVFITNDDITAKKIKITVSEINNDKVLIKSGLENVKSLIVSGSAYLNDNSKIKILN